MNYKLVILVISAISLVGCTTMRPIDTQDSSIIDEVKVGDHVIVYERSGRTVEIDVDEISYSKLSGSSANGSNRSINVNIADIEKVEVEKIDGIKTTLAIVGGTVVVLPVLFLGVMSGTMLSLQ